MLMEKSRTGGRDRRLGIAIKTLEPALAVGTRDGPRNTPPLFKVFLFLEIWIYLEIWISQITADWYLILDMSGSEWCRGKVLADVVSALPMFVCPFYLRAQQFKLYF